MAIFKVQEAPSTPGQMIKAEMKLRRISYKDMATRLFMAGTNIKPMQVKYRIQRDDFEAGQFLQWMDAMGCAEFQVPRTPTLTQPGSDTAAE